MIQIFLSEDKYEYDIHSLVKAFYPEEQIKVIKTLSEQQDEKKETGKEKIASCVLTEQNDKEYSLQQKDINIYIEYEDAILKVKAVRNKTVLYPDMYSAGWARNNSAALDLVTKEEQITKPDRNRVKRTLYNCLSHITGRELPWGTLTGVRPTKIAFEKLDRGIPEAAIKDHMKEQYLCSAQKTDLSLQVAKRERTLLQEMDYRNGCSIYIGIPFCPSTCLYCSFTSYSLEKFGNFVPAYLEALYKEITYAGTCGLNKKITTIYLGGGTPTTLTAGELDRLLDHIGKTFDFTHCREYTVEAGRPDSITRHKLKVLKDHGVTRISINPQTMSQKTLDLIGRRHSVEQVTEAFQMAREIGHDNINMDIIIGLPGEGKDDTAHTLNRIDRLRPDSLTVHTLALKRAARLNIQKEEYQDLVPTDTLEALKLTSDYAKTAGYLPYYLYRQKNMADNLENIGYAKFGKEGLYNILIMEEKQTILALGAGALSKFVFHEENRIERVENVKSLKDYVERIDGMIERKRIFLQENAPCL